MSQPQDPRRTVRREASEQIQPLKRPADRDSGRSGSGRGSVDLLEHEGDYESLAASLHGTWGNTLIQAALAGEREGPAEIIHGAMTLGAGGMSVPESSDELFANGFVNDWISDHGAAHEERAPVMRRADGESFQDDAPERLERAQARSGKPMPEGVRKEMEAAFGGVDFSGVRIHTDATAREASRAIRAQAYTVGQDVYFDEDFDVTTQQGQHLLAHELTHVVQHQEGRLRAIGEGLKVSSPTDVVEQEAERMAHQVTAELDTSAIETTLEEAPSAEMAVESSPESAPVGGEGEGVFRRRRPNAPDPRALKMKADVKARDQRRANRTQGPRRGPGTKLTPERHERLNQRLEELLQSRGPELLAVFGWGAPTEADAKAPKPPKGAAGPEGERAKGYANWKKQYKEDGRWELEQHQDAGQDLIEFLEDVITSYQKLGHDLLGKIGHEDAWRHFTECIEDREQEGANEGPAQTDGDNQENEAHDGLEGHFDANHHKARRHGDGKTANSATAGAFDSGDDSASGQDDVLHGEEKLAGGSEQDAASPKVLDVRRSVDCLVDEANRFALEFMREVDGDDITEGTGQGGELAALQANVAPGGGVQDEGGDKPGTDERRQTQVAQAGTVLYSRPGAMNPGNVTGRLPAGTKLQASSDTSRPGWTSVTVTEGPMAGQRGWISSGAEESEQEGGQPQGSVQGDDLIATIDALLSQGQRGVRQAEEMIRDPRQALVRMAGGVLPPAVKETLGEAFGWLEHGRDAGLDLLGGVNGPQMKGQVQDLDGKRAQRTLGLVRQLTSSLGLAPGAVKVQADAEAARRTRRAGTRGIQEAGRVFLDPSKYDPTTADGRELLAHEVVHVAQRLIKPEGTPKDGRMVEAEAGHWAARFARGGGKLPAIKFGMPRGHRAREGDVGGADLKGMLTAYQAQVDGQSATIPQVPAAAANTASTTVVEDREQKVDLYGDGVDGIADEIGDTSAFDSLYDAICDEKSTRAPLARVRRTQPYRQLCRMWQGAKEGGPDRGQMMRLFNSEFDGRGFWSETEQAYDMIEACAKRDARPEPEAGAAREAAPEGAVEAGAEEGLEQAAEGQEAQEGQAQGQGGPAVAQGAQPVDAAMAELMGQPVPEQAPAIGSFDTMKGIGDGDLDNILSELTHRHNLSAGSYDVGDGRGSQIFETLGENFGGSFVSGFVDQGLDGLIWDNVGFVADQGIKLLSKGRIGTPMIGPLIGLASNPPWKADAWGASQFGGMAENWSRMGESWDAVCNAQGVDKIGALCGLTADFVGGLRDMLAGLQTIAGTLSALCYVGGGILILFGLALVWFFGVGAPLITAGLWITRMGGILGRVATVLGAIVLALTAITTLFRVAAAFMVPADMYAQQLELLGLDATQFGQRAGAKVADTAAEKINAGWRGETTRRVDDHLERTAPSRGQDGASASERIARANDEETNKLQTDAEEGTRKVHDDDQRRQDEQAERQRVADEEQQGQATKTKKPPGRIRRFIDATPVVGKSLRDMEGIARDLGDLVRNPGRNAREALSSGAWQRIDDDIAKKAAGLKQDIDRVRSELAQQQNSESPDRLAVMQLKGQLVVLEGLARRVDVSLGEAQKGIQAAQAREQLVREQRARDKDEEERKKKGEPEKPADSEETRKRIEELEARKTQQEEEIEATRKQAEEADAQARKTASTEEEARTQLKEYTDSEDYQNRRRQHQEAEGAKRSKVLDDVERLQTEAHTLEDQAAKGQQAAPKRARASELQAEGQSARIAADEAMRGLRQSQGTRIKANSADGGADGMIDRKLISVGPEGAVISNGRNATEHIPLADIKYPKALRELAQRYLDRQGVYDRNNAEATKLRGEADALSPSAGVDPVKLREQAAIKRNEAFAQKQRWEDMAGVPRMEDGRRKELEAQVRRHMDENGESGQIAFRLRNNLTRLRGEHQTTRQRLDENRLRLRDEQAREEQTRRAVEWQGQLDASSGNATGGVGSTYKDGIQALTNGSWAVRGLISSLSEATKQCEYVSNTKPQDQSIGFAAEVLIEDGLGIRREVGEELLAKGREQAERERIRAQAISDAISLAPPTEDIEAILRKREAAMAAYDQYVIAHTEAHAAFVAEQAVGGLSAETRKLADSAEPVKAASQGMAAPLATSKQDEQRRQSHLAGGGDQVQKPQGGMAGIVGGLIAKFASHGSRFKGAPNAGDPKSGEHLDQGGQMATEAPKRKQQSAEASDQQRVFLDAAIAARQAQETQMGSDQESVETKYEQEQAILEGIKTAKGEALQRRETHRAEVERQASGFNTDYQGLESWRSQYVSIRQTLESTE